MAYRLVSALEQPNGWRLRFEWQTSKDDYIERSASQAEYDKLDFNKLFNREQVEAIGTDPM